MRFDKALTVTRLELTQLARSRDYWVPLIALASLFFVLIPWVLIGLLTSPRALGAAAQIAQVVEALPNPIQDNVIGATPTARAAYGFAVYLLAPVAIIVPLTISSAVGANSMVGEKEKRTGEFLAHSPLRTEEIYVGKLIGSLVPGYLATVAGFAVYSLVVNFLAGSALGGWFFPTPGWWLLIFWVIPPFIAIALSVIVRVSARVRSAAAAQQAATLVTLPVIVTAYAISSGLLITPVGAALLIGAAAWLLAALLLVSGARAMSRERLLGVASERR